jgi:hypothetical protein
MFATAAAADVVSSQATGPRRLQHKAGKELMLYGAKAEEK